MGLVYWIILASAVPLFPPPQGIERRLLAPTVCELVQTCLSASFVPCFWGKAWFPLLHCLV